MSPCAKKETSEGRSITIRSSMQALRAEMEKHPNPMFGRMLAEGPDERQRSLLDFSINVAHAYFTGALLEPVAAAAGRELERMTRQTLLKTAALFGMTATFDKDRGAVLKSAWKDQDTQTAAVQALVDTGLSVKEAMASFKTGPPEQAPPTELHTRLPEAAVN